MLKLRLKRYGKKREPSYRIVVVESRSRRQGRPLQELGFYNPRTKETRLDTQDLLKWLRNGAQPTETLSAILRKAGIYDMLKAGVGLDGGEVAVVRIAAVEPPPEVTEEPPAEETEIAPESETAEPESEPAAEATEPIEAVAEATESTAAPEMTAETTAEPSPEPASESTPEPDPEPTAPEPDPEPTA